MADVDQRNFAVVGLQAAMDAVTRRVRDDLDDPEVGVFVLVLDPAFATGSDHAGPPVAADVVVETEGRRFAAGLDAGVEACCATTMSALQDEVVDRRGRPWPEVVDVATGRDVGVLDVALEPAGIAHWRLAVQPLCPVGELRAACHVLGWRLA